MNMPPQITGMRCVCRPTKAVSALPIANSIPAMAKSRPIRPVDAPAARNWTGTSRADTPVVTPAVRMAAAAQMVLRSEVAARRLAVAREGGEPSRTEHHPWVEPGEAEQAGIGGHDGDDRELGGRVGKAEAVDEDGEHPPPGVASGGLGHCALLGSRCDQFRQPL